MLPSLLCVVLPSTSWHLQMKTPPQTLLPYPPLQPHPPLTCLDEEARSPPLSPGRSHTLSGDGRSHADERLLTVKIISFSFVSLSMYDRYYFSDLHMEGE